MVKMASLEEKLKYHEALAKENARRKGIGGTSSWGFTHDGKKQVVTAKNLGNGEFLIRVKTD
jgi:hypothetical protein